MGEIQCMHVIASVESLILYDDNCAQLHHRHNYYVLGGTGQRLRVDDTLLTNAHNDNYITALLLLHDMDTCLIMLKYMNLQCVQTLLLSTIVQLKI